MPGLMQREFQVAFSRRAQPIWFRVVKWIVILAAVILLREKPYFWTLVGVTALLGFGLHFFYRWKTRGWTKPWGGWNDVERPT